MTEPLYQPHLHWQPSPTTSGWYWVRFYNYLEDRQQTIIRHFNNPDIKSWSEETDVRVAGPIQEPV